MWMQISTAAGGDGGGDRQPPRRGLQLQGPRPSPLSVNKESRKIGKPPAVPRRPLPVPSYQPPRAPPPGNREPVIIYAVSPKVIYAEASDFMAVVQRLTGVFSSSTASSSATDEIAAGGPISPAAMLAALEWASPTVWDRDRAVVNDESELLGMVGCEEGAVDFAQIPGILSPAPANLPAVPDGMFSPVVEPQTLLGFQDNLTSPLTHGNYFLPSPGSASFTMFSPIPSPVFDFSTLFDS